MKRWSLALFFMCSLGFAKQQLVFLINTGETDFRGGKTADYIDEHYDQKMLEKIFPKARVIRIRASKTEQITEKLNFWMLPNPDEKEVAGLFISSHGTRMFIANEKKTFQMRLPFDIKYVFEPIIGRFAPNARIIFNGCRILKGKDKYDVNHALSSILDAFGVEDGMVYANHSAGLFLTRMWMNADPLNPEVVTSARIASAAFYAGWFVALPIIYIEERIANRGYIMNRVSNQSHVYKATFFDAVDPDLNYQSLTRNR